MNPLGRLFVFEGVDGVGKTSLSAEVAADLRKRGELVETFGFPGRNPGTLGELVYRLHHQPSAFGLDRIAAAARQTLHIAAHLDAIENVIVPALSAGCAVILDRFWWSTWAYGVVEGVNRQTLAALLDVERKAWGKWNPTLFYIDRSEPLKAEPIEDWRRLRLAYRELIESETGKYPIHIIDNQGTQSQAVEKILKAF